MIKVYIIGEKDLKAKQEIITSHGWEFINPKDDFSGIQESQAIFVSDQMPTPKMKTEINMAIRLGKDVFHEANLRAYVTESSNRYLYLDSKANKPASTTTN